MKEAETCPRVPFWNFLSILKGCIKDIEWATKDMGTCQYTVIAAYNRPKFIWRNSAFHVWEFVENPRCIINVLWQICVLWPAVWKMKHVGACPLCDGFYVAFSNTILVLCTYTTEGVFHLVFIAVVFEFSCSKNLVVRVVTFYLKPLILCHCFQSGGTLYGLVCSVWILWKVENFPTSVVYE
jgi:hypothetical protein